MTATLETEAEELRCKAQRALDSATNGSKRNKMGQVATPTDLAIQMAELAKTYLPTEIPIRFLDPALGTGVFFYAVRTVFGSRVETAHGYEIDESVANVARQIWGSFGLTVHVGDFCIAASPDEESPKPNHLQSAVCPTPSSKRRPKGAPEGTTSRRRILPERTRGIVLLFSANRRSLVVEERDFQLDCPR
jgi:hypothetical protein